MFKCLNCAFSIVFYKIQNTSAVYGIKWKMNLKCNVYAMCSTCQLCWSFHVNHQVVCKGVSYTKGNNKGTTEALQSDYLVAPMNSPDAFLLWLVDPGQWVARAGSHRHSQGPLQDSIGTWESQTSGLWTAGWMDQQTPLRREETRLKSHVVLQ